MSSANILTSDDRCHRREYLSRSWEKRLLSPTDLLRRAVDFGLQSDADDPGQAAGDEHMRLCTERGIDTDTLDLLTIADHGSALADMLVWTIRGKQPPWEHPEDVQLLPDKCPQSVWESSAYLSADGTVLRQVWVTDRWTEQRILEAEHSWYAGGECATYGISMTLIVAVIGQRRESRWSSPWTRGYLHPVSQELRFERRDGEPFKDSWEKVWRESFKGDRADWLDAMTADGVLGEHLIVHRVEVPRTSHDLRTLAAEKMDQASKSLPLPQLSQCFDSHHPCPFRSACPNWRLPSQETGFVRIHR